MDSRREYEWERLNEPKREGEKRKKRVQRGKVYIRAFD